MRILCLLLPHFAAGCELLRHPELKDRPVAVISGTGSQKRVLDASAGLEKIHPGMPLAEALSWYREIEVITADMPCYRQEFNRVLDALETCSPLVEGTELGRACLGLDGLELIYPTDEAFTRAVREVVPPGFALQMGIATGKFPAYLAACRSLPGGYFTFSGNVAGHLGDVSCDVLPVSLENINRLRRLGLRTLAQVAALLPGPIGAQFGAEGRRMQALAQGQDDEPLRPRCCHEIIEESTILPGATVSLEGLLATAESLLNRAFRGEGLRGRGIRCLKLWTRGWRAECWEHVISFKEPAMDIREALPRIRYFLERYPQPGPVEQMGFKLTRLGYGINRQNNLFAEVKAQHHLLENIKELQHRLGAPPVYRVKEIEPWSRIPERRYALASVS
jgi:DNA polymerase IV